MSATRTLVALAMLSASTPILKAESNGLRGEYFNNMNLSGKPDLVRTDSAVDFRWYGTRPAPSIRNDRFSIRWTGQVEAPATGAYRFAAFSDDGIRVWINDALVIQNWTVHSPRKDSSVPVALTAGQKYNVKVEFFENAGGATAKLMWTLPNGREEVIPRARLSSGASQTPAQPKEVSLSQLNPWYARNGWGAYSRDRSNGEFGAFDGRPISIAGAKFSRGLGVHARSELRFWLARKFQTFQAMTGIDDETRRRGSVIFQVWVDDVMVYQGPIKRGGQAAEPVSADLAGKNELRLIVLDAGDGIGFDHADWADAKLTTAVLGGGSGGGGGGGGGVSTPGAPAGLTAIGGDKLVTLNWTAASGAVSYNVYRGTSSNGQSGTPIASGMTGTTFANSGLTNGTKYLYKVRAVNSAGMSEPSNEVSAQPAAPAVAPGTPTGLSATGGDKKVTLNWMPVGGAASYNVYRGASSNGQSDAPIATGLMVTAFTNNELTNGTAYFYKIRAVSEAGMSPLSSEATATPSAPAPAPAAPTGLMGTAGDKLVTLNWTASPAAASYSVYRGTSSNGQSGTPIATGIAARTFTNTGLTNGTTYFYKVRAVNANGTSEPSNEANAKPAAPPPVPPPASLTAAPGNQQITLNWTASSGAASYNLYRGTSSNGQSGMPVASGITSTTFTNTGLTNGTTYFYKVAAVGANAVVGERSSEASAAPTAPGPQLSQAQKDAFQFLRQATWGPNQALVNQVAQSGKAAFLDAQFAAPPSVYPDELIEMPNMELVSERFFQNALQGQDQLRQRVAWALSQIFVASAIKVDNTHAMVPYIRMLHARAFGNVQDIMRDVSLSPAMGEFLDMVNNKKATSTGAMPNENYPREWMQLFSIGLAELNDDGTPQLGTDGQPLPTYGQETILDLAKALTGWTYGDNKAGNPTNTNSPYYEGPMEPVEKYHDTTAKQILGVDFPAGQTTQQDFDQALSVIFNHHNVGPFLSRQLIQRLVTSNPSPQYIRDVATVFNNNGQGARGDLRAVVRAILLHPEAVNGTPTSGKFAEPALSILNLTRALEAQVVDHPVLSDYSQEMAQRIWFAPSVFNYFSPGYRASGIVAPELQIWSTATAMTRTNFVASLVSGGFGNNVTLNLTPFTAVAADPGALVDAVNAILMGGTMGPEMRQAILTALAATTNATERVRTALYLAGSFMQYQVEH